MIDDPTEDGPPAAAAPIRPKRRLRSTQELRQRRGRLASWGLSAVLSVLLVNSLVGENGYLASLRTQRERAALQAAVAKLRIENQHLQQESRRLQQDPAALEETARRELGMIRPGETLVVIRNTTPSSPAH